MYAVAHFSCDLFVCSNRVYFILKRQRTHLPSAFVIIQLLQQVRAQQKKKRRRKPGEIKRVEQTANDPNSNRIARLRGTVRNS